VAQKRTQARRQTAQTSSWKPRDASLPPQPEGLGARFAESLWASPFVRVVVRILGALIVLGSVAMVIEAAGELIRGNSKTEPGVLVAIIALFVGFGYCGVWLIRSVARAARRDAGAAPLTPEQRILALASTEDGRVTVAEVAATCHLDLDEAKQELDKLVLKDAARMEVTDEGVLVYELVGFLSDDEKERAKGL
jgi:hypothetical protein